MKCKYCGKEFNPSNAVHAYCSQHCREHAAYKKKKDKKPEEKTICLCCGKVFIKSHGRQKYCCASCRENVKKKLQPDSEYIPSPVSRSRADNLSKIEAAARAAGMTYGQYQAFKLKDAARVDIGGQADAGR